MSKANKVLGIALLVQAALVVFTWAGGAKLGGASDTRQLVEVDPGDVTALEIVGKATKDKPARTIKLAKKGDDWVVATAEDFPAKKDKVDEVVKKLVEARVRDPIASQKANHAALKVSEKTHDKKVRLQAGGKDLNLVIGSGKGSSIHARFADQDEVFLARGVSAWSISDRIASYLETDYVKVEDPTEVSVQNEKGTINVLKDDSGKWKVSELPPDADVDDSRVSAFVSSARSVRLAEPVGKETKPEYGLDGGVQVVLKNKDATVTYVIGAQDGDHFYVKAQDHDYVVKVSKWSVDKLRTQTPDKFIREAPATAPPQAGMGGMGPGGIPPGMRPPGLPPGMTPPRRRN